jgi:hypothetical protein
MDDLAHLAFIDVHEPEGVRHVKIALYLCFPQGETNRLPEEIADRRRFLDRRAPFRERQELQGQVLGASPRYAGWP